ncbi:hypothetical protein ACFVYR_13975 [Streptomyces sp. NPDC058284]|uniref:hypothetical protein n=1 Tax=unclassified Streptomyces TaxID=2593676 RepID=UPI00365C92C6
MAERILEHPQRPSDPTPGRFSAGLRATPAAMLPTKASRRVQASSNSPERTLISSLVVSSARSVRVRWNSSGEETLDVFHEGATRMAVHSSSRSTYFSIEFQMGECAGKMSIQVFPNLAVTDQLLFV